MRIVIDMQGAQTESRFRGIGRYAMSFAQAMVRNGADHEIVLALNGLFPDAIDPIRAAFRNLLPRENVRVWYALGPVREGEQGNDWRRSVAEYTREAFLAELEPDAVVITSLFEGYVDDAVTSVRAHWPNLPTAVVFHDLIPWINRGMYLDPHPRYDAFYRAKMEQLKHADLLLAISESSAEEVRAILGLPAERIATISAACDPVFRPMSIPERHKATLLAKFGIVRPFVLYSGAADPRKNLPRLIRAYAGLPHRIRRAHQLVLAGKMHHEEVLLPKQAVVEAGLDDGDVVFTGYVSEQELIMLYNLCKLFVLPSLHEGFGLPALEAMACGAAVIGANTTSVPEVIGNAEALFDPHEEEAISRKLAQGLADASFRKRLVAHGKRQVRHFSWDASASRALAALARLPRVDGERRPRRGPAELASAVAARIPAAVSANELRCIAQALAYTTAGRNAPRQLLVDVSELARIDVRTGVQRVTRSVLKQLMEHPPGGYTVRPVRADTSTPGYRYANQFAAGFTGIEDPMPDDMIDCSPGDVFLGLDLQPQVVPAQSEYLAFMRRHGVAVWFVVHDLLPILLPHTFPAGAAEAHTRWLEAITLHDGAICVSRAVADQLSAWVKAHRPPALHSFTIDWFHPGADIESSMPTRGLPEEAETVLAAIRACPSFLMTGTLEPRKRHLQALEAFEELWREGHRINLVIVGKQGWMVEQLVERLRSHPELHRRLFWLEGISDEYLEMVYQACTCLIAASEGEGFGLPLIEAARHKLPIIARDIPVFREVAGEHAAYFHGLAPADLAIAVTRWLALRAADAHPKPDGLVWRTWRDSTAMLLQRVLELESGAALRPKVGEGEHAYRDDSTAVEWAFGGAT